MRTGNESEREDGMDKNLVVSLDEIKGIHIQCKECECEVVVSPAKPYFYGLTCPQGHPWQERPFSSFIDTFLGALRQLIESPALFKAVRLEIDAKLAEGRNEYGMDKRSAMEMVNEHLGNRLLYGRNTSFANISGPASLWWMTIDPSKFKSDLHLLLAKEGDGGLIWLRIEGNSFPDVRKVFRVRQDKDCIDLEISSRPPKYMTDVKSGGTEYDFTKHIEHEWGRPAWTAPGT